MGAGASASVKVPASFDDLDVSHQERYRNKFDEMTGKALPIELDDVSYYTNDVENGNTERYATRNSQQGNHDNTRMRRTVN